MTEASKPMLRSGAESGDALTGWLVASTVVIAALQRAMDDTKQPCFPLSPAHVEGRCSHEGTRRDSMSALSIVLGDHVV